MWEISKPDLAALAVAKRVVRSNIEEYRFADGRRVFLLAEGRLVNLAAGDGHPAEVMDTSFALQALSCPLPGRKRRPPEIPGNKRSPSNSTNG